MPIDDRTEIIDDAAAPDPVVEAREDFDREALRVKGTLVGSQLAWLPRVRSSSTFADLCRELKKILVPVIQSAEGRLGDLDASEDVRWMRDATTLIYSEMMAVAAELKRARELPHVRNLQNEVVPRVLAVAQGYLKETSYRFHEPEFAAFCRGLEENTALEFREFRKLPSTLKLVLLQEIAVRGQRALQSAAAATSSQAGLETSGDSQNLEACIRSLREVTQTSWKEVLEPLIPFDKVLRQDPTGTYANMDYESRDLYRERLSRIAVRSDLGEVQVAQEALAFARQSRSRKQDDPRMARRKAHIGYYLTGSGAGILSQKVGARPTLGQRLKRWVLRHPDEVYMPGVAVFTGAIMTSALLWLTSQDSSPFLIFCSMLFLLLPCSQSAVQLVSFLVTAFLTPEILPKLDFSRGLPDDCVTLIAVPTLLLNEKQVRGLIADLEVRYLGNHDRNMHFALVSDLPDSDQVAREDSPLIGLCSTLIEELNQKYAAEKQGSFFLLHRHRIYNPREKGWMGWERKRGKLLDLNKLLRGQYDSFPVKVGDLSLLSKVRFVITLDSDTELPRGSAHRMAGTLAHPLNQAIIDPEKKIVVAGYGILQPRVEVSVQSTARSRLAAIYAGETGLDIYTRAVSDAYQDLYGEGSFTGKGIYEVDTVQQVLDRRFPRNALLSHDLIEGAYARAGLVSDIDVIEDYPSHYSAYNRRKHRWLRGDWQIAGWLFSTVPQESGGHVPNPISLISRWKILDNLRRSLVEPATFFLFVFAWLAGDGRPVGWTVAAIVILFLPVWFQFAFNLGRAAVEKKSEVAREATASFFTTNFTTLLTLVFLAHQTLLSLDAVGRALVRRTFTRERMLEWETAAEAEAATKRTPVEVYLEWLPLLSVALGVLVWWVQPRALPAALPLLLVWACTKAVSGWLNRSPIALRRQMSRKDVLLLRRSALHTWRYFAEFCTEEHHWLIPDNVQEEPPAVAARVSPTNLGLLLNAQQVACELGYLTVPEMAIQAQRTLSTLARLPKDHGHLLNWYDTRTLQSLKPEFVSSVDSGNLLASLWTLQRGCLAILQQPLLRSRLADGVLDHLCALVDGDAFPAKHFSRWERELKNGDWLGSLFALREAETDSIRSTAKAESAADIRWFQEQTEARLENLNKLVEAYTPWELPGFATLPNDAVLHGKSGTKKAAERLSEDQPSLAQLPQFIDDLQRRLEQACAIASTENTNLYKNLLTLLPAARANSVRLAEELRAIAAEAGNLADAMDFTFLMNTRRKLLSVGFNVQTQQLEPSCYDLLATESRTAMFAAIAKEDIPQECWFRMGRGHTLDHGRPVLLSWTGTMFEYLMPALWLRAYPNTLLERTQAAAVESQRDYAGAKNVPWGISESAYYKFDDAGNYQYRAFGLPQLGLMKRESYPLIISPYSTLLALMVDSSEALHNLHRMDKLGWFGPYGFYESADYSIASGRSGSSRYQLVRCWMAHHQGMGLLSLANVLCENVIQEWFHSDRRVQATELLLHEKPVSHVSSDQLPRGTAA